MRCAMRLLGWAALFAAAAAGGEPAADADAAPVPLHMAFAREVSPRLELPADEALAYAARLQAALEATPTLVDPAAQFVVLVDRSPQVQAALVYYGVPASGWALVGAAPVATGLPGSFEHFETPLGVVPHTLDHPDFRAEGTKNAFGIRGYGRRGMRVYDFGWVAAEKGWGDHATSVMRLQMHATDPDRLEPLLGLPRSKGCIRISAALNTFIDRHGLLDADYRDALVGGANLWVLRDDREWVETPGRLLVVVDSGRAERPPWSPAPRGR